MGWFMLALFEVCMEFEIWKTLDEYPDYEFSNLGRIKNNKRHNPATGKINKCGYREINIRDKNGKAHTIGFHILIATAFLGPHPGLTVNHIDCNKLNNKITNLEFVTREKNSSLAAENYLGSFRKVKINETGEIFNSVTECEMAIGYPKYSGEVSKAITKNKKLRGLSFSYVEDDKKEEKDFLYQYQRIAVSKMHNGCILNGGTGTGKSRTGLYYYFQKNGGSIINREYIPMNNIQPLYILTTAMKRDKLEWEDELANYCLSTNPDLCKVPIVIDSWNNIKKYINVKNAFFIFDEDKVCGTGSWAKCFLKITKSNEWIILSASPGDRWLDYMMVFIANGYYRNQTEFKDMHVEYDGFCTSYPKIKAYHNEGRLLRLKKKVLVEMDSNRKIGLHHIDVYCDYDRVTYKKLFKERWNPSKMQPIQNASELCYEARKIVNLDDDRAIKLLSIIRDHSEAIVFYNFDYELEYLKQIFTKYEIRFAEYNGHIHEPLPEGLNWIYLVQYNAGAEGWNCTTTDTVIFYSQNYSYKMTLQAAGRINRSNTPFMDLYYYHLKSRSPIDISISKALDKKKKFNEGRFISSLNIEFENS